MPKVSQPDKEAKEKVYIWIAAYQENGDQDAQYNLVVHYKNLVESSPENIPKVNLFMKI